jgi:hypothetical protein
VWGDMLRRTGGTWPDGGAHRAVLTAQVRGE